MALEVKIVQDPKKKSRLRELAPDKEVAKLLKAKGIALRNFRDNSAPAKSEKPADPEKARRQAEKETEERAAQALTQKIEAEAATRILKLVHEKWKGPMKRDDLELIADHLMEDWDGGQTAVELCGKRPSTGAMNERDLGRLIVAIVVGVKLEGQGPTALKALAKRLKIDPKAIEKEVRAELTGQAPKPEKKAKRR
jgi:hypothetical protein